MSEDAKMFAECVVGGALLAVGAYHFVVMMFCM